MINTPNKQRKFELRVLLFDGERYAVYLSVRRHDIYTSAGHFDGRDLFRQSHHWSGQTHLRIADRMMSQERNQRPDSVTAKVQIACTSTTLGTLIDWSYKPKKESQARRNIIVDIRNLPTPQVTAELWAIESNRPENVSAILAQFKEHLVIHHEHIAHIKPEFVVVIWTLSEQKWMSVMQAFRTLR
jgi:hypothetical protein